MTSTTKLFHFCLTTGAPGYLPDDVNYVEANSALEAYTLIEQAIADFKAGYAEDDRYDGFEECQWRNTMARAATFPDASMWHFELANVGSGCVVLDLIGMTASEWSEQVEA